MVKTKKRRTIIINKWNPVEKEIIFNLWIIINSKTLNNLNLKILKTSKIAYRITYYIYEKQIKRIIKK